MTKSSPTKTKTKTAKSKADDLFSQLIRSLGYCERCGKTNVRLETSHWISRRYAWTRTYEANAFCFCHNCHQWWHDYPTDSGKWAVEKRGQDVWEHIRERSSRRDKFDWHSELKRLQDLLGTA